ncbi:MAG TPA: PD-(D/E)XK nuclease family protein [Candidatus Saccharimonadales bacterium]|nr:PD-(D/E)XK nuclease family protein [Candidatus Saccharimonadales bacterium]
MEFTHPDRNFHLFIVNQLFDNITIKQSVKSSLVKTNQIQFPLLINPQRYYILFLIKQLDISDNVKYKIYDIVCLLFNILADVHRHTRDQYIQFYEEGHKYDLLHPTTKQLLNPISVTTLIHRYFPDFDADGVIDKMMLSRNWTSSKYFGLTKDRIKEKWERDKNNAAGLGTMMHAMIEYYLNGIDVIKLNHICTTIEYRYFLKFWSDFKSQYPTFYPYRTEFLIFDEQFKPNGLAGSIDCLLKDDDGHFIILDWKRSKEIKTSNYFEKGYKPLHFLDHCNYNHYSLQLNIYRHILETKYHMNVIYMMLVILHPNNDGYKCIPINHINLTYLWQKL